jgi:uncharacterized membrane protein
MYSLSQKGVFLLKFFNRAITIKICAGVLFIALFVPLVFFANQNNPKNNSTDGKSSVRYVSAKVLNVVEDNTEPDQKMEGTRLGSQEIEIEITSGVHKGERSTITNYLSALHNVYTERGTGIIVRIDTQANGSYQTSVYNYNRAVFLYIFIALFILILCIIGGKKGVKAVIGLVFTLICVVFILIPLVMKGLPAIYITVGILILTTVVSFIILDGINQKTISAVLGTAIGVLFAGLCSIIMGNILHLSGFNMEQAESLLLVASDTNLKIRGLMVCAILISSLGAVMDMAISIASSVQEIYHINPKLSSGELFHSGMNIGRDAMGTMAFTLILAFTGSSFNMLLLIFSYGIPFAQLINTDLIGTELLQAIAATIGIIVTVPVVALISSRIIPRNHLLQKMEPAKAKKKA